MRLILTAFSFLLAATASAQEVGGSFDLGGKTTSDLKFDMVAVSDVDGKNDCSAYGEGAIGMDDKGLILSCQSGSWKKTGGDNELSCLSKHLGGVPQKIGNFTYGSKNYCPAGYSAAGFQAHGKMGINVEGGHTGSVNAWIFCCQIK